MPSGPGERYDFFLSRRGSVAAIAQEVADVLTEKGYKVFSTRSSAFVRKDASTHTIAHDRPAAEQRWQRADRVDAQGRGGVFLWAALAEVAICAVRLEKEVSVPTGA